LKRKFAVKQYTVTGLSVQVNAGILVLTQKQYQDRKHLLKKTELDDHYEVVKSVMFKRHETFGHDGELGKSALADVEVLNTDQLAQELASIETPSSDDDDLDSDDDRDDDADSGDSDEDTDSSDDTDTSDDETPVHDVAELAGLLGLTLTKTRELLRDKHGLGTKDGRSVVPDELFNKLAKKEA